ncbi:MAG: hypothetical protein R2856_07895 [Caldilineaceae bacterium]
MRRQVSQVLGDPALSPVSSSSVQSPLTPSPNPSTIQRTVAPDAAPGRQGGVSTLSGVESAAMPVAQRYHVPVRRNTAVEDGEPDANGDRVPSSSLPTAAIGEKITITSCGAAGHR